MGVKNNCTVVRTDAGLCKFEVKVSVHQGSVVNV